MFNECGNSSFFSFIYSTARNKIMKIDAAVWHILGFPKIGDKIGDLLSDRAKNIIGI